MTGIIETTVYLSVTALVILLFKWIFKNKLSAKWHVWIWALLAIRLVLPSLPESSFSIFNAIDIPEKSNTEVREELRVPDYKNDKMIYGASEIKDEKITIVPDETGTVLTQKQNVVTESENSVLKQEKSAETLNSAEEIKDEKASAKGKKLDLIVNLVHFSGAGLLFIYFVSVYIICVRRVSKNKANDGKTQELLQECKRIVGIKRNVSVIGTGNSPMLMGLVKPKIILPEGYTEDEKKNIIIHELCHLKGGDIYLLWLAMVILCLNWFNPVMWICFFIFRRDIEVYCDERVLKYIDSKKDYAALLVKTALKKNSFIAGTTSLQNGEKEVERRVKYMAYFKKPNVWWTLLLIVIAAVIGVVCLTDPKQENDGNEKSKEKTEEKLSDEKKQSKNASENENSKGKILESTSNFLLKDRGDSYYYEVYDNNGNILLSKTSEKCPAFTHLEGPLYELKTNHGTSSWECKYFNVETGYKFETINNAFYLKNGVVAFVNNVATFSDDGRQKIGELTFIELFDLYDRVLVDNFDAEFLKDSTSWIIEHIDDTHIQVTYYTDGGKSENKKVFEIKSRTVEQTKAKKGEISLPAETQTSNSVINETKDPIREPQIDKTDLLNVNTVIEEQSVKEEKKNVLAVPDKKAQGTIEEVPTEGNKTQILPDNEVAIDYSTFW